MLVFKIFKDCESINKAQIENDVSPIKTVNIFYILLVKQVNEIFLFCQFTISPNFEERVFMIFTIIFVSCLIG